jgi:hypothetical protein
MVPLFVGECIEIEIIVAFKRRCGGNSAIQCYPVDWYEFYSMSDINKVYNLSDPRARYMAICGSASGSAAISKSSTYKRGPISSAGSCDPHGESVKAI